MLELLITLTILVNAERATPVWPDVDLSSRAVERAESLCETKQWGHEGWLESFKGVPYKIAGENLARGFNSPNQAFKAWMNSPSHKANIVKPTYTHFGAGQGSCVVIVQLFKG